MSTHDYTFNIVAQGGDPSTISHAAPVSFSSGSGATSDFSITNTSVPQSVVAGTSAQYVLTFTPGGDGTFANSVSYTCSSSLVPLSGCSFNPVSPIAAGSDASQITLTVTTTGAIASLRRSTIAMHYAFWLPLTGLLLVNGRTTRRERRLLFLSIIFALVLLMSSCSAGLRGGGEPGTPPGEYTVTVNASERAITHSLQVTLTVRLRNDSSKYGSGQAPRTRSCTKEIHPFRNSLVCLRVLGG